jgi:hypothetical protein
MRHHTRTKVQAERDLGRALSSPQTTPPPAKTSRCVSSQPLDASLVHLTEIAGHRQPGIGRWLGLAAQEQQERKAVGHLSLSARVA